MSRIALLIKPSPRLEDDNYLRFAPLLAGKGHDVSLVSIDSLAMTAGSITGRGFTWDDSLSTGSPWPESEPMILGHDLIWILSVGERPSFLDKFQLLYAVSEKTRVINSLDALMHLNSKYYLPTSPEQFPQPETHASRDASELRKVIEKAGGRWIVKPPAGSLGRDVFLVDTGDSNLRAILQHMCGQENTNYTLIQRYIPEIESGEKRVLMAGGKVIDQYRRIADRDHRTNVNQGAKVEHCDLSHEEAEYCQQLALALLRRGVLFAGIDLAWPWLIEINVINPGGIQTIDEITARDNSSAVVDAVLAAVEF